MTSPSLPPAPASGIDSFLVDLIDELGRQRQAGAAVELQALVEQYPQYAEQLRQMWPAIQLLAAWGSSAARGNAPVSPVHPEIAELSTLGDFRIVRKIGHGGMGVVYEAEQISLKRRVALKVLPFAAALDPRRLQRFKLEAQAAAHLHHTHIVPVYAVGCERGVHYYAMEFIDGQTLAAVIQELRQRAGFADQGEQLEESESEVSEHAQHHPLDAWIVSQLKKSGSEVSEPGTTVADCRPGGETAPHGPRSALLDPQAPFFRVVAQLGVRVAEALEHAHQEGVVHRDIKPANLLVDRHGDLWITDFGLARLQNEVGLTMSGDLLGTLRYMSPEQVLGERGDLNHRTDIYSLGVTLYELLTLRPARPGRDRQEVLRQIEHEEPKPPRRLNPKIPADLETIVRKAIARNPAERYQSAQALADDLRRFLEHKPIRARRPAAWRRLAKWARRRPAVAALLGVTVLAATVLAGGGVKYTFDLSRKEEEARGEATKALKAEAQTRWQLLFSRNILLTRQLQRAQATWGHDVAEALAMLEDVDCCHPEVRDFAWGLFYRHLKRQLPLVLRQSDAGALTVFAPDGKTFATTGFRQVEPGSEARGRAQDHNHVTLWDVATRQKRVLNVQGEVTHLAFRPDGQTLAVAWAVQDPGAERPRSSAVTLFDVATGQPRSPLAAPDRVAYLAFSPDGGTLASVWTTSRHREVRPVEALPLSTELSPRDGPGWQPSRSGIQVWDLEAGHERFSVEVQGIFSALGFSPGGRGLAAHWNEWNGPGTFSSEVCLWDVATGWQRIAHKADGHVDLAFGAGGRSLAVRYEPAPDQEKPRVMKAWEVNDTMKIWDVDSGEERITALTQRWSNRLVVSAGHYVAAAQSRRNDKTGQVQWGVLLWDARSGREAPFLESPSEVSGRAFSPDGKALGASWVQFGAKPDLQRSGVTLWDVGTRQERFSHEVAGGEYAQLAFVPDGSALAVGRVVKEIKTGQWLSGIRLVDAHTGRELPAFGVPGFLRSMHFAPGGKVLIAKWVEQDPKTTRLLSSGIRAWDVRTGREFASFTEEVEQGISDVNAIEHTFSSDGQVLAIATGRGMRLWNLGTGAEQKTLSGVPRPLDSLGFKLGDQVLVVGATRSFERSLILWDVKKSQDRSDHWYAFPTPPSGDRGFDDVTLADAAPVVAETTYQFASETKQAHSRVKVRDVEGDREQAVFDVPGRVSDLAFTPDGRTVAAAWNVLGLSRRRGMMTIPLFEVGATPGRSDQGASGQEQAGVTLFDVRAGRPREAFKTSRAVELLAFAPDGGALAASVLLEQRGGREGFEVQLWDLRGGQERVLAKLPGTLRDLSFSPGCKGLVATWTSGDKPGQGAKVWDADTGQELVSVESDYWGLALAPDARALAVAFARESADPDQRQYGVQVWDVDTGQPKGFFTTPGKVGRLRLLAADRTLAAVWSTSADPGPPRSGARWWGPDAGQKSATPEISGEVVGTALSPDGRLLALACAEQAAGRGRPEAKAARPRASELMVLDVRTGQIATSFRIPGEVERLQFMPDGQILAGVWSAETKTGRFQAKTTLWEATTGQERVSFEVPGERVELLSSGGNPRQASWFAFSPDGKLMAMANRRQVILWDTFTGQERMRLATPQDVVAVQFLAGGKVLAACGSGPVVVWVADEEYIKAPPTATTTAQGP